MQSTVLHRVQSLIDRQLLLPDGIPIAEEAADLLRRHGVVFPETGGSHRDTVNVYRRRRFRNRDTQ